MKYTFQQRKYVYNRLLNAVTTKVQILNTFGKNVNSDSVKRRPKMVTRTITSQLIKSEQTFTFPKTYATKMHRVLDDLEKLEESMFLADAPELKAALNKIEAKIETL